MSSVAESSAPREKSKPAAWRLGRVTDVDVGDNARIRNVSRLYDPAGNIVGLLDKSVGRRVLALLNDEGGRRDA